MDRFKDSNLQDNKITCQFKIIMLLNNKIRIVSKKRRNKKMLKLMRDRIKIYKKIRRTNDLLICSISLILYSDPLINLSEFLILIHLIILV
jgi:hypothetical protein